jgi:hypothetical protein
MVGSARRLGRADLVALVLLTLLPTGAAVVPTIAGRPLMGGDNALQNYPLRVLVGASIRHGHLPLFDPYLWSGTPLLAGWNAGAAFPGTWLFAIFPAKDAWTMNLVAVGVLAALGMYWFLRRQPVRPVAAFLAALSFTFTGFLAAQNVHIGLVLGTALLPWICLGIDALGRREPGTPWVTWSLVTAVAVALTVLAGDPRAVSNDAAVAALLALAWCWRRPGRIAPFVGVLAVAGILAVALSAIQWLPGLQFLHQSERGAASYSLYGIGSLSPSWGVFALVPYLLGGNGNFGLPGYVGPLNWPEIGMSVGLLPIVAMLSLPVLRARRSSTGRGEPSGGGTEPAHSGAEPAQSGAERPAGRQALVWYLAAAGGILLSLGSKTPLGHLLWHLPLFGAERLQGRNIAITDFAVLVVFALWVDEILPSVSPRSAAVLSHAPAASRLSSVLAGLAGALPGVAAIAVIVVFSLRPVGVEHHLSAVAIVRRLPHEMRPYLIAAAVLAALVTAFAVGHRWLRGRARVVALCALSVAEVLMFALNAGYAAPPAATLAPVNPETAALARLATASGRYAFYDPFFYVAPGSSPIDQQLGFFDLGIVHDLPSVQGYGSVVAGSYQQLTSTHQVGNLNLGGVHGALFDVLDLKVLLTSPLYLAHPLVGDALVPTATASGRQFVRLRGERHVGGERPAESGPWLVGGNASAEWFFPAPAAGATLTVVLDPTVTTRPHRLVVGFQSSTGHIDWVPAVVNGGVAIAAEPAGLSSVAVRILDARFHGDRFAAGLPIVHIGAVVVQAPAIGRQLLDGLLQGAIASPHWEYAGEIGSLPAFVNSRARGLGWVVDAARTEPDAPLLPGSEVTTPPPAAGEPLVSTVITPRPALLVSSIAWTQGWEAQIRAQPGGAATVVQARQLGPVVAAAVPAGRSIVTWVYRPARAIVGVEVSLFGALGAVLLALAALGTAWLRRRRAPLP